MKKYSFIDILSKEIVIKGQNKNIDSDFSIILQKIDIPMIQRDYAQGRPKESELRDRFLNSIFDALLRKESLDLDFIYGSFEISDDKRRNNFIPLDGQQRLTTLFLLYWYFGSRELDEIKWRELQKLLNKFTYSTRASSRKFCDNLVKTRFTNTKSPKAEITNLSWFFRSYEKDPTVKSILYMLDSIHEKYNSIKNNSKALFDNLQNLQFYILPLNGFNLSEELYVKMNARGKQLTDFENLKADLINWMEDDNNPDKIFFQMEVELNNRQMPYHLSFSQKMDINWASFFWNNTEIIDEKGKDEESDDLNGTDTKIIDPLFMRFFNRYFCNLSIINLDKTVDEIENKNEDFKYFYGNAGDDSIIQYKSFKHYKSKLDKQVIQNLGKILDCISNNFISIKESLKPSWETNQFSLFDRDITQRQRIAFFATTIFIEKNDVFSIDAFRKWMRFVWNIIVDPNIRTISSMIRAMRFILKMAEYSGEIDSYLINYTGKQSTYSIQFEEESFKAILISNSNKSWNTEILEAESHPLFRGNIRFMLTDNDNTSFEDFVKNKKAAFKIFSNNDLSDKPENYLWVRAMSAKSTNISHDLDSDLQLYLSNGSFYNWRYLINGSFIEAIRKVIKEVIVSKLSIEETLSNICNKYKRDPKQPWVYPLVKWVGKKQETLLGNFSVSRKIRWYDNYKRNKGQVYLYNKKQWTDRNLILSSYRNEIIAKLITNPEINYIRDNSHCIQGQFFRGWEIPLWYNYNGYPFDFVFDTQYLSIGIKETDDMRDKINVKFGVNEQSDGWICLKKYDYNNDVQIESDIDSFIEKINREVFDENNGNSLYCKINNG